MYQNMSAAIIRFQSEYRVLPVLYQEAKQLDFQMISHTYGLYISVVEKNNTIHLEVEKWSKSLFLYKMSGTCSYKISVHSLFSSSDETQSFSDVKLKTLCNNVG